MIALSRRFGDSVASFVGVVTDLRGGVPGKLAHFVAQLGDSIYWDNVRLATADSKKPSPRQRNPRQASVLEERRAFG